MKLHCSRFRSLGSLLALGVVLSSADVSQGVPIKFDFGVTVPNGGQGDGSDFDGGFGTPGATITLSGLSMKIMDVKAPAYVENPTGTWTWNGTTYVDAKTNITGTQGIGIDNPSIGGNTPINSESSGIHPAEFVAFEFNKSVVIRQIVFQSLGSGEQAQVEIEGGLGIQNYTNGDTRNDPFGAGDLATVIPMGTDLIFRNTNNATNAAVGTTSWRIGSVTVEVVPEPSATTMIGIGLISLSAAWRRRKK